MAWNGNLVSEIAYNLLRNLFVNFSHEEHKG